MSGSDADSLPTAVVLLSGGMDSATAAYQAYADGYDVHALHINYYQQTSFAEYQCAVDIARALGAEFESLDVGFFSQIAASVLVGADDDAAVDDVPATYVPFRNAVLITLATAYAELHGCSAIYLGVHAGDHADYPDCTPEFIDAINTAVELGTSPATDVEVVAPFVDLSKAQIVERGTDLGVPYDQTWSCYMHDAGPACGTCGSCRRRRSAFRQAGSEDPLDYDPDTTSNRD